MEELKFASRRKVTPEMEAEIRSHFNAGMDVNEIALLFKLSKSKIQWICTPCKKRKSARKTKTAARCGRKRDVSDETIQTVHHLYDTTGFGCVKIARITGIPSQTVLNIRRGVITATPEECPLCGRIGPTPCVACTVRVMKRTRPYPNDICDIRLGIDLEGDERKRYLELYNKRQCVNEAVDVEQYQIAE